MENVTKPLILSCSPHFHSVYTTNRAMLEVTLACLPAAIAGIYFFGLRALMVIAASVIGACAAEWISIKIMKRPATIADGSAVLGIQLDDLVDQGQLGILELFADVFLDCLRIFTDKTNV